MSYPDFYPRNHARALEKILKKKKREADNAAADGAWEP